MKVTTRNSWKSWKQLPLEQDAQGEGEWDREMLLSITSLTEIGSFILHTYITLIIKINLRDFPGGPVVKTRGPQPPGRGPVPVHGLLGTRPHSRRWAVGGVSEASSATPHRLHYRLNNPPSPVCGKTVFHETSPWCQKGWGPQLRLHAPGTSQVAEWLRICLPMQGTCVRSLVQEDPTCHGTTKPMHPNCWAHTPQLLKPTHSRAHAL